MECGLRDPGIPDPKSWNSSGFGSEINILGEKLCSKFSGEPCEDFC